MPLLCRGTGSDELSAPLKKAYHLFDKTLGNAGVFRVAFLAATIFYYVNFYDRIFNPVNLVLGIWAICVFVNVVFIKRLYFQMRHWFTFGLFMLASLLSVLLNWRDNLLFNFFTLGYSALYFVVFFGCTSLMDYHKAQRELRILLKIIVLLVTAITLAGALFVTYRLSITIDGYHFGFFEGRFYGIFTNPNYAGFLNALSIVCAQMLLTIDHRRKQKMRKVAKAFLWLSIPVNLVSLWFTDSNAALVLLGGYGVMLACGLRISYLKEINWKTVGRQSVFFLLAAVLICGGIFFTRTAVQDGTADAIMYTVTENEELLNEVSVQDTDDWVVVLGGSERPLGSGRDVLVKQGLEIFTHKPLFGVGPANIETAGDRYLEDGLRFPDLHNAYLTILVGTGVVGFACCCTFFVGYLWSILNGVFNRKYRKFDRGVLPYVMAFILSYGIYAFAEKALVFHIDFTTAIFWMFMGYAGNMLIHLEKKYSAFVKRGKPTVAISGVSRERAQDLLEKSPIFAGAGAKVAFLLQRPARGEKPAQSGEREYRFTYVLPYQHSWRDRVYRALSLLFPRLALRHYIPDYDWNLVLDKLYYTGENPALQSLFLYNRRHNDDFEMVHLSGFEPPHQMPAPGRPTRALARITGVPLYTDHSVPPSQEL